MGFGDKFKALSDPTRREILMLLRKGPMSAGEIGACFSMTGATVSHHLTVLKGAGIIDDEKRGKYIYYTLNTSVIDDILNWVLELKGEEGHEK
ncbi:autorepressor SdpR family transcription factor [Clostridium sp. AM58-1XD]|uniref:autorepressor SdpR family transcription factor n=1 Tax=Clostridium sp. AM58-1XD TaxID=2292307 RepID=UPI000E47A576|nr:autorepressor SdpR family transcription factor [Clostridium sp. AM58-1XD]RGY99653.1 ArsR family transcriptional regulator [Clostridium sp. AM58-1XD]